MVAHTLNASTWRQRQAGLCEPTYLACQVNSEAQYFSISAVYNSFFKNNLFIFILYALMFCLHVCLRESVGASGTRVIDRCKLLLWMLVK